MHLLLRLGPVTLVAFALGCGGSTDSDNGSGGTSSGGASTGGASSGGASTGGASTGGASTGGASTGGGGSGGCSSLVPCCDANGNEVSYLCENNYPVCPPGAAFSTTGVCTPPSGSCSPSMPCAADEYCDYGDDKCGAGQPGSCKKRPQGCDLLYAPVCACDGKVAGNECAAYSGGTDINANGGCPAPQGQFACGPNFCEIGISYCQRVTSDVGGYPDSHKCMPLPSGCGSAPSCACLANEICGTMCSAGTAAGELTLTCPGG